MKPAPRRRDIASVIGVPLTIAIVLGAQLLEGGALRTLLQPTAALVVFGGTLAALLVSYPVGVVRGTVRAAMRTFDAAAEPDEQLVQAQVVPGAVMVPSGWDGPARLVVMDHAGRVVVARREVVPPGGAAIELGELAPGGYLVRLELTGRRMVGRTFIH